MASGDAVQQIKDRLSIIDVISPYVELHNAGKNLKGKSPFTPEKTPSFYVSPDRGMYYCFSSSQGGDMFTFVQAMEGVDFKGALKILADKAGVELVPEDPKKRSERDNQYALLEDATKFFEAELSKSEPAMAYLKARGVKPETIGAWRIGYVPGPPHNGWRHTREYLSGKKYTDAQMIQAGLVKTAGEGKEPYDVFRDRIMFPIFDASGRVVAYSGRVLEKDTEAPKYVNSPETELFNKSEILYGYDKAKQGIRKFDFSLIVEGQFDVVLAHQAGYSNTVAVSGTAFTSHHASLLQRLSNRVVLALDADRAGISAVKRAAESLLVRGIDLKVARIPAGKDPADLIQASPAEFKKVIGSATHVIEFLLDVLKADVADERTRKLKARDEVLPYLLKIESQIDREHFIGIIATALNTSKDAIKQEVERLQTKQLHAKNTSAVEDNKKTVSSEQPVARHNDRKAGLLTYICVAHELVDIQEQLVIEKVFTGITDKNIEESRQAISPEERSQLLFTLEQEFADMKPHLKHYLLSGKLEELHAEHFKDVLKTEKEKLRQAESKGDETAVETAIATINTIQKKASAFRFGAELFDK